MIGRTCQANSTSRVTVMRQSIVLHFLFCLCLIRTQAQSSPSAAPQLTPQAAYDQATRPLEIPRRSAQNWSEVELAALQIAIDQAKASCNARTADQFTGEDLLAYARLCGLGKQWGPVEQAASIYLYSAEQVTNPAEKLSSFPNLTTAFDYEIHASLHLIKPRNAVLTVKTMLQTAPYDNFASEAINDTVRYVQLTDTDQALALLSQRQPILLSLIKSYASANPHAPLPLHVLYAEAVALPAMQQFANQVEAAAASFAKLETTLPTPLAPDDAIFIAETRRQYLLLGSHLPTFTTTAWLLDSLPTTPQDFRSNFGSATVFFLFPDWCNQCVALNPTFNPSARRLRESNAHFFVLLAQANPSPRSSPKEQTANRGAQTDTPKSARLAPFPGEKPGTPYVELQLNIKSSAAALLAGTPTFVVPKETLDSFVATDFPLIVVTDHQGIIRAIQPAPDDAMIPGSFVDQLVHHVIDHWPSSTSKSNTVSHD